MSPTMTPAGYSRHERHQTADHVPSTVEMGMQYDQLSFQANTVLGYQETFIQDIPATYIHENPVNMQPPEPPQQTQGVSNSEWIKRETSFPLVSPSNTVSPGVQNSSRSVVTQPPPLTVHEFNLNMPSVARGRGRGRGKGSSTADTEHTEVLKRGKGRAATQGVLIPIAHVGRQEALAEQAAKRKRADHDEPYDDSDERALEGLTTETSEIPQKKQKSETSKGSRKGHTACDRCVRNKTKCHRQVDGKPPGKSFPCDFCANINGICTTAMAGAMKPEALTVADDSHWKSWKFKDVITEAMEADNLWLRKKVENFEEKYSQQERVHEALKSELNAQKSHVTTLQKALERSNDFLSSRDSELRNRENLLRDAHHRCELLKERLQQYEKVDSTVYGIESVDVLETPGVNERTVAIDMSMREPESPRRRTPADVDSHTENFDSMTENSIIQTRKANINDIIHKAREIAKRTFTITQLNEYVRAYFANVHPLLPILHKEAFLRLYKLYAMKALPPQWETITDGSSREGRAVSLIGAVLALGALSLAETRTAERGKSPPHFGEAMEFYTISMKILSYTHDTLETMMAYLLMSVFAVSIADIKEAFRRLNQFQTQAVALDLKRVLEEGNPEEFYEPDLWPGVTRLVVYEMAKRSWSMFRVYLSNVAMELGRRANFYDMEIPSPTLVDDEYFGFDVTNIDMDYEKAPNPVRFLLVLQVLSTVVDDYTKTAYPTRPTTRNYQGEIYKRIRTDLEDWKLKLPTFLNWEKPSTGLSARSYLAMQRALLETHYLCVKVKVSWSLAHLDSMLMPRFQPQWFVGNIHEEIFKAGERIIKVVEETGLNSESYHCFHWDIVRALTTLLQILLRNQIVEADTTLSDLVELCQHGLQLSRKLVPESLTKAEDLLEAALNQYLTRRPESQIADEGASNFEIEVGDANDNIKPVASQDFQMPADNLELMLLQHGIGSYSFANDDYRNSFPDFFYGDT